MTICCHLVFVKSWSDGCRLCLMTFLLNWLMRNVGLGFNIYYIQLVAVLPFTSFFFKYWIHCIVVCNSERDFASSWSDLLCYESIYAWSTAWIGIFLFLDKHYIGFAWFSPYFAMREKILSFKFSLGYNMFTKIFKISFLIFTFSHIYSSVTVL